MKHPLVNVLVGVEGLRSLVYAAATALDAGSADAETLARMAKAKACDVYVFAASRAVQLHGGFGFTLDCDAHLYLKRAQTTAGLRRRQARRWRRRAGGCSSGLLPCDLSGSSAGCRAASEAQRERWLRPWVAGEARLALAVGRDAVWGGALADVLLARLGERFALVETRAAGRCGSSPRLVLDRTRRSARCRSSGVALDGRRVPAGRARPSCSGGSRPGRASRSPPRWPAAPTRCSR